MVDRFFRVQVGEINDRGFRRCVMHERIFFQTCTCDLTATIAIRATIQFTIQLTIRVSIRTRGKKRDQFLGRLNVWDQEQLKKFPDLKNGEDVGEYCDRKIAFSIAITKRAMNARFPELKLANTNIVGLNLANKGAETCEYEACEAESCE